MKISIFDTKAEMGAAAATEGAEALRAELARRGAAGIVLATGTSQFEMLEALVAADGIDWSRVTAFHLDEYIGLPLDHPASFRGYLKERFAARVPDLAAFHYVDGQAADPVAETERLGALIRRHPIAVAFIGIGENGHLAFNDPPADFETEEPFIVVMLDEACRKQQLGEGWFPTLEDVPSQAISMSIRHILSARKLVVTVPDARKALAVKGAVEGEVSNLCPASILRTHPDCHLFLDEGAASMLSET